MVKFLMVVLMIIFMAGVTGAKEKLEVLSPTAWISPETMAAYEKAFELENPDIAIVVEQLPVGSYMESLLLRGKLGNDFPDTFLIPPDSRLNTFINGGLITEIDRPDSSAIVFDMFSRDGILWAYPQAPEYRGVVNYNKRLFAEAGITNTNPNWEEFKEILTKLTIKDEDGNIIRYGALSKYPNLDFIYAAGAGIIDDAFNPTKVLFGSELSVSILEEFMEMTRTGQMMPHVIYNALGGSKPQIFGEEKVAMVVTNSNYKGAFQELDFEWDIFLIPSPIGGEIKGVHGNAFGWCISSKTEKYDLAMRWIEWIIYSESALNAKEGLLTYNKDEIPYVEEQRERLRKIAENRKPNNWNVMFELEGKIMPFIGTFEGSGDFGKVYWNSIWNYLYGRAGIESIIEGAEECQALLDKINEQAEKETKGS